MINVESQLICDMKIWKLQLACSDSKAVSPQHNHLQSVQQECISLFETAVSQIPMEASFLQTNRPTVLQCLHTNWGCCKFRDK